MVTRIPQTSINPLLLAIALVGIILLNGEAAVAQTFFQGLGSLPGNDEDYARPIGISGDGGTIVGQTETSDMLIRSITWDAVNGVSLLDNFASGTQSVANAASFDGKFVVGDVFDEVGEAFRLNRMTGEVLRLGDLPGGNFSSTGIDISDDGSVVVGYSSAATANSPNELFAYRWTESEGMVSLGDLPGGNERSLVFALSGDGTTVVGSSVSELGQEAFRWTEAEGMVGLGDLPGGNFRSTAIAASENGTVITGRASVTSIGDALAFRWTEQDGMQSLGTVPGAPSRSIGRDISADGSLIVGTLFDSPEATGFIWDEQNGMRRIEDFLVNDHGVDLGGWSILNVLQISADGLTFAGLGRPSPGQVEGWVARIPEPATVSFLVVVSVFVMRRRRMA